MHRLRHIRVVAEARALEDLALKLQRRVVEVAGEARVFHEGMGRSLEMIRRFVTRVIHEVNGFGSGHDVNGQTENQESRANDDANKVVLEVKPKLPNVVEFHLRGFD